MKETTIFTELLESLGVPHTVPYSNDRYREMPFKSLFGFSRLLRDYGIDSEGMRLDDRNEVTRLDTPFLAQVRRKFVIITAINDHQVSYVTDGAVQSLSRADFDDGFSGIVLAVYPREDATEPDYHSHRMAMAMDAGKRYVLIATVVSLFLYLFISNGLYRSWSAWLVTLLDLAGLYVTYLLLLKTLNIKSHAAESVCNVIEAGGCGRVLKTPAAKFFGLFGWSEVGFAYFGVSLLTLLIFPQWENYLALFNACCLPFSFWSVWYQKFRAKSWCTLCLTVQATLWLLFFVELAAGWFHGIFPLRIEAFVLGASYLTALLTINRIIPAFEQQEE